MKVQAKGIFSVVERGKRSMCLGDCSQSTDGPVLMKAENTQLQGFPTRSGAANNGDPREQAFSNFQIRR